MRCAVVVVVAAVAGCPDFGALRDSLDDAGVDYCASPPDETALPLDGDWRCGATCDDGFPERTGLFAVAGDVVAGTGDGRAQRFAIEPDGAAPIGDDFECRDEAGDAVEGLRFVDVADDGAIVLGGTDGFCVVSADGAIARGIHLHLPSDRRDYGTPIVLVGDETSFLAVRHVAVEGAVTTVQVEQYDLAGFVAGTDTGADVVAVVQLATDLADADLVEVAGGARAWAALLVVHQGVVQRVAATVDGTGGEAVGDLVRLADALDDPDLSTARVYAAPLVVEPGAARTDVALVVVDNTRGVLRRVVELDALGATPFADVAAALDDPPLPELPSAIAVRGDGALAVVGADGLLFVAPSALAFGQVVPWDVRTAAPTTLTTAPDGSLWASTGVAGYAFWAPAAVPAQCDGDGVPTARGAGGNEIARASTVLRDGRFVAGGDDAVAVVARGAGDALDARVEADDAPAERRGFAAFAEDAVDGRVVAVRGDGSLARFVVDADGEVTALADAPFAAATVGRPSPGERVAAARDPRVADDVVFWIAGVEDGALRVQRCSAGDAACDASIVVDTIAAAPATLSQLVVAQDLLVVVGATGVAVGRLDAARTDVAFIPIEDDGVPPGGTDHVAYGEGRAVVTPAGCVLLFGGQPFVWSLAPDASPPLAFGEEKDDDDGLSLRAAARTRGGPIVGAIGAGAFYAMDVEDPPGGVCASTAELVLSAPRLLGPLRPTTQLHDVAWSGDALVVSDDRARVWRVPLDDL